MTELQRAGTGVRAWFLPLVAVSGVSLIAFAVAFACDAHGTALSFVDALSGSGAGAAVSNLPEVVSGLLGIAITVVAIVVELAANRYTPRVADLFVRSPINIGVLGFFVVAVLFNIWVGAAADLPGFVPSVGVTVAISLSSACLVLLLPYFAFVFHFLAPQNIIDRIAWSTLQAVARGTGGRFTERHLLRERVGRGVEHLADVALNAIENKDKGIATHAVESLGRLGRDALGCKDRLPGEWFRVDGRLAEDPDFVSLHAEVREAIARERTWFETKILRQYQMLYGEAVNRLRDVAYLIAIDTRRFAEAALQHDDEPVLALTRKFFNTYLRQAINARDVRTVYNVLNQYRQLAETALRQGRGAVAREIAERFKYYGQLGFAQGLPFVLETAAYDLCTLNELAFELEAPEARALLAVFLEVDKEAVDEQELEASLRGVRKAQIKLATFYLVHGAEELARTVFEDMRHESPARIDSLREELSAIVSRDFWEISDRGVNFDYLEPERRAELPRFLGWFDLPRKGGA